MFYILYIVDKLKLDIECEIYEWAMIKEGHWEDYPGWKADGVFSNKVFIDVKFIRLEFIFLQFGYKIISKYVYL